MLLAVFVDHADALHFFPATWAGDPGRGRLPGWLGAGVPAFVLR